LSEVGAPRPEKQRDKTRGGNKLLECFFTFTTFERKIKITQKIKIIE